MGASEKFRCGLLVASENTVTQGVAIVDGETIKFEAQNGGAEHEIKCSRVKGVTLKRGIYFPVLGTNRPDVINVRSYGNGAALWSFRNFQDQDSCRRFFNHLCENFAQNEILKRGTSNASGSNSSSNIGPKKSVSRKKLKPRTTEPPKYNFKLL